METETAGKTEIVFLANPVRDVAASRFDVEASDSPSKTHQRHEVVGASCFDWYMLVMRCGDGAIQRTITIPLLSCRHYARLKPIIS